MRVMMLLMVFLGLGGTALVVPHVGRAVQFCRGVRQDRVKRVRRGLRERRKSLPWREKMCSCDGQFLTSGVAMVPFSRLLEALCEVPDPRRAEGKRDPLPPLLLFTGLALLSGATSYRRIITFVEQRRTVLHARFGYDLKRAPSLNTRPTVLQALDPAALEEAFRRHAQRLLRAAVPGSMPVIALDGKTLKGSFDHLNDRKAAQTLSAFASEAAILLAHSAIDDKNHEIAAAQHMIAELGLTGVLFTRRPARAATRGSPSSRPTSQVC